MNERIQELAEQAKLQLYQDIKDGKKDWRNTPQSYDEMVQEKFAELIVRECIVDFYRRYLDTTSNEDITVQVERYIQSNFGVES